jgi:hypothetical protein
MDTTPPASRPSTAPQEGATVEHARTHPGRWRTIGACLTAVVSALAFATAASAACDSGGSDYSYAGLAAGRPAFGVGATLTALPGFDVEAGHVAGWVGVGGPRLGPHGTDEWIQVGLSTLPGSSGGELYFELAVPNAAPVYHSLLPSLIAGRSVRVAVLEMRQRTNWWRVWVDGRAVTKPILLPSSHGRWSPIATGESWDGGTGDCNDFLYSFHRVSIARVPGGGWTRLVQALPITGPASRVIRNTGDGSFLAASGETAIRALASAQQP